MTAHSKIVEINRSQGDANIAEAAESGSVAFQDEQENTADSAFYGEEDWQDEPIQRRAWGRIALFSICRQFTESLSQLSPSDAWAT